MSRRHSLHAALLLAALLASPVEARAEARRDIEVRFRSGDVTLAGTLSLPAGREKHCPVAVLISGDGPQDLNGVLGGAGLLRSIADSLVAEGVAVLRQDDRGAGQSTTPAGPPSYRALLGDTRAAIAFARGRRELDPNRVALVGHSEGSKSAAFLAVEDPEIAAIAMLAGATAVTEDSLLLPKVHCPVLILQGGADRLVAPHHAAEAAAVIRSGGNRRVTDRVLPGLSHVFNHWAPGVPPTPETQRIDPEALHLLVWWMRATLGAVPPRSKS